MYPVVRIIRPFLDREPLQLHYVMIDCVDEASAVAAIKPEPGDKVEFAWWMTPDYHDYRIPPGCG